MQVQGTFARYIFIGTGYRVQVLGASKEHRYRVQVHGTNTGKGVG